MNDLNSDFVDRLIELAGEHPNADDSYWDYFWRLKKTDKHQDDD